MSIYYGIRVIINNWSSLSVCEGESGTAKDSLPGTNDYPQAMQIAATRMTDR